MDRLLACIMDRLSDQSFVPLVSGLPDGLPIDYLTDRSSDRSFLLVAGGLPDRRIACRLTRQIAGRIACRIACRIA
jgi:hypothetical protein